MLTRILATEVLTECNGQGERVAAGLSEEELRVRRTTLSGEVYQFLLEGSIHQYIFKLHISKVLTFYFLQPGMVVGILVSIQFAEELIQGGGGNQQTVMERTKEPLLQELVQLLNQQVVESQIVVDGKNDNRQQAKTE